MSSAQKVSEQNLFFRLLEAKAGRAKGDGRAKGTELVAFCYAKKPLNSVPKWYYIRTEKLQCIRNGGNRENGF